MFKIYADDGVGNDAADVLVMLRLMSMVILLLCRSITEWCSCRVGSLCCTDQRTACFFYDYYCMLYYLCSNCLKLCGNHPWCKVAWRWKISPTGGSRWSMHIQTTAALHPTETPRFQWTCGLGVIRCDIVLDGYVISSERVPDHLAGACNNEGALVE